MDKIIKNPLTSITGLVLALAAYVIGHPDQFGDVIVHGAALAQPLSALALGMLAKDAHSSDAPKAPQA